ncbi:MAG TPA: MaoC/PaaZ C-terminal domain-containing protein [Candidatus Binataceae bacterium]|nr:MaoC/PaaZ C-terminal domain-containing protein [Candidatus Binataceae bacterium]
MALNQSCIGREYPAVETRVSREAIRNYALACNDDNPRYLDPAVVGGIIAPPLFGVTVTWESLLRASGDPEVGVDVMRLLHGEQDMEFLAPIRPGDVISSRSRIASIETRATGEALDIEVIAHNQNRNPVLRTITGLFIRGTRRERSSSPTPGAPEAARPAGEPIVVTSQTIDRDQTFRYAEASGDRNPIHLDENVARMVGLPGIIVHGLCTMAFVSRVVVDALCDRDPARLKRLRVRFTRPVFPGQTINTLIWHDGEHEGRARYALETYNSGGQPVIRGGIAEIAPATIRETP